MILFCDCQDDDIPDVFIVWSGDGFGHNDVLGVFSSYKKAIKYINDVEIANHPYYTDKGYSYPEDKDKMIYWVEDYVMDEKLRGVMIDD